MTEYSAGGEALGYLLVLLGTGLLALGWHSVVMYFRTHNERIRREQIQGR